MPGPPFHYLMPGTAMPDSVDRAFGAVAVQRGHLTPAQLERCLRELAEQSPALSLSGWLQAQGVLTAEQAAAIDRDRRDSSAALTQQGDAPGGRADAVRATAQSVRPGAATPLGGAPTLVGSADDAETDGGGAPASDRLSAAPGAATRLGKYELLEELGRGGMGVVYRALDTELRREVALKTLLVGDARNAVQVDRLLREARTAAALDHPGIVPIYDVGIADGVPYLAMACLRGRTLDGRIRDGTLRDPREKARLALEIARAVGHAHDHRIIHRDIKPSNVLIDEAGSVHVMDFGLAKRLDDGSNLTAAGQVLGTPQYMSPEQIDGDHEHTGPASDVYSIGAVLYEMLVGRPPFTGATFAEIVAAALRNDPEPPRRLDAGIHADLETICLKCLDKEPVRRYPGARELAGDLERYRNGEPIEARPATWATQTVRRVARYRVLAGLVAVALCGLLVAAWMAVGRAELEETIRAEAKAKLALQERVRADLREKSSLFLDAALSIRRAGVSMKKAGLDYLPRLLRAVEEAERVDPSRAEPHWHLGRLYRALMRFDQARAAQEDALRREPDYAPARYERAVLAAHAYARRIGILRDAELQREGARLSRAGMLAPGQAGELEIRISNDEDLERTDEEAAALRRILFEDVAALERVSAGDGPLGTGTISAAQSKCVRGLALAYGPDAVLRRDEARTRLEEALREDPSLEEAYEALAHLGETARRWEEVARAAERGLEADRGYVPFWRVLGIARHHLAEAQVVRGADGTADLDAAEKAYGHGLALHPDDPGLWTERGALRQFRAMAMSHRGEDGVPVAVTAAADLEQALALDPSSVRARILHANNSMTLANIMGARGEDPEPHWTRALADLEEATRLDPRSASSWAWRGSIRLNRALHRSQSGTDPITLLGEAAADFDRAIELDPRLAFAWEHRGDVRLNWGNALQTRGADPDSVYASAASDYRRALTLDPRGWGAWSSLGLVLTNWASWQADRGQPSPAIEQEGLEAFARSTELNPGSAQTWELLGIACMNRANRLRNRGEDPLPGYREAIGHLDRALGINARSPSGWVNRAWLHAQCGTWAQERGDDPEPAFARADADYAEASKLNPGLAEIHLRRGSLRLNWGVYASGMGRDAEPHYRTAVDELDAALRVNPSHPDAWRLRGGVQVNWAGVKESRGEDPEPHYREAIAAYGKCLDLNPRAAHAWMQRAMTRMNWGLTRQSHGQDPETLFGESAGDYDRALEINPRLAEAWRYRAALGLNWAGWRRGRGGDDRDLVKRAIDDLDQALELDPSSAMTWSIRGTARWTQAQQERAEGGDAAGVDAAARQDFEESLRLNPRDADTLVRRGRLHFLMERWEEALADFDRAQDLNPASVRPVEALRAEARQRRAGDPGSGGR